MPSFYLPTSQIYQPPFNQHHSSPRCTPTARSSSTDSSPPSCQAHTSAFDTTAPKHGRVSMTHVSAFINRGRLCVTPDFERASVGKYGTQNIPKHIGHDEESHMRASDVDLVEMTDSPIARRDSNIFELDVHIIFGYNTHNIRICLALSC